MTDSIIESIARMLCQWECDRLNDERDDIGPPPHRPLTPDCSLGGDGQNFFWHEHIAHAKELLAVMREPTEAMRHAIPDRLASVLTYRDVGDIWRAMIDAALAEADPSDG